MLKSDVTCVLKGKWIRMENKSSACIDTQKLYANERAIK